MDEITRAFRDLTSMIATERDARRKDVREIRAHLKEIDQRLADGDERTTRFETSITDGLAGLQSTITSPQDSVERRLSALEQWRKDQTG